jgi:hypothetical protein
MKNNNSIGTIRNLSTKYAEIRRNVMLNDSRRISPNNSDSFINDHGKMRLVKFMISNKILKKIKVNLRKIVLFHYQEMN